MTVSQKSLAKILFGLSLMLCISAFAQAHKVNIFAALDGNMIVGRVYFSGGGVAEDVDVEVFSQDGLKVSSVKTNSKGEFIFVPKAKDAQYLFSVDTGDGHAAKTTVAVGSPVLAPQGPGKVRPPTLTQLQANSVIESQPQGQGQAAPIQVAIDPSVISGVVSTELSKQLLPLSARLDKYESSIRLSDILGGIGYIFGVAGLLAFLWSRRIAAGQGKDVKDSQK